MCTKYFSGPFREVPSPVTLGPSLAAVEQIASCRLKSVKASAPMETVLSDLAANPSSLHQ